MGKPKFPTTADLIDLQALRAELAVLAGEHAGREPDLRAAVLERCKVLVGGGRDKVQQILMDTGKGLASTRLLSDFQDELIRVLYDFTVAHVYRGANPSAAERISVIATGGYGRGTLAPGSDIDLLFLLPYRQTAWGESVVEYLLYFLWDLGFKVGHATRNIDDCIRLAKEDLTIRTAILEARHIWGDRPLFDVLVQRFDAEVIAGSGRKYIEEKLQERDERHRREGESRYLVEPNVKDGKGGLRDLQTLFWIAKYVYRVRRGSDLVKSGLFTQSEYRKFIKCDDFLWSVRSHIHFLTGRSEERLSFDIQPELARRLGYTGRGGLSAVERFMKHYFLIAKDVGDLTRIFCSILEMKEMKAVPSLNEMFLRLRGRSRTKLKETDDFIIESGRITATSDDVFEMDPVNFIRLFHLAEKHNVLFHPDVLKLVSRGLHLIGGDLRKNPQANRMFLELLTWKNGPEAALRRMNEAGVLGRFMPAFGRIVAMMQFSMYHHYTVDEHLIRVVGNVARIEQGELADEHPLSSEIIHTIENRRALYVAALLHDIAKGRDEDHTLAGRRIAAKLCPRLGMSAAETETVAWLVEHHLVMSTFSQRRDVNDPKTVKDFAGLVQSRERLKLLLILTVADIRGVGPGVWNGWKGQLLRALYFETDQLLAGGHSALTRNEQIEEIKAALRARLIGWSDEEFAAYAARHYQPYWIKVDANRQAAHAALVREAGLEGKKLVTSVTTDAFTAITEVTVFTPDHPRLLAIIAGVCCSAEANIADAQISTTRDGMALDTVFIQRAFEAEHDERRRGIRIAKTIEEVLRGDVRLGELMARKKRRRGRIKAFRVAPQVTIDNTLSDKLTVIEVAGLDRPGFLYDITQALADLSLNIASAHITTYGERAVDSLYVTDLTGAKIENKDRQNAIRARLMEALALPGPEKPGDTAIAAAE